MKSSVAAGLLFISTPSMAAIVPDYNVANNEQDAVMTPAGGGVYTVSLTAETYNAEIWERPIEGDKFNDAGGTRTTTGKYYAFGDLDTASWGVGSSGTLNDATPTDYIFIKWDVVGLFIDDSGSVVQNELTGIYYFYIDNGDGANAIVITLASGAGLGSTFGDSDNVGKVKWCQDTNGDVPDGSISQTWDDRGGPGGDGFETCSDTSEPDKGYVRSSGTTVEVAVKLADLPSGYNSLSDFAVPDYVYIGVAVSNPSSPSDLFANDHFSGTVSQSVEYDTLLLSTTPSTTTTTTTTTSTTTTTAPPTTTTTSTAPPTTTTTSTAPPTTTTTTAAPTTTTSTTAPPTTTTTTAAPTTTTTAPPTTTTTSTAPPTTTTTSTAAPTTTTTSTAPPTTTTTSTAPPTTTTTSTAPPTTTTTTAPPTTTTTSTAAPTTTTIPAPIITTTTRRDPSTEPVGVPLLSRYNLALLGLLLLGIGIVNFRKAR